MTGKEAYSFELKKENLIGEGGFARVFKAKRKYDQQVVAIKRSRDQVEFLDECEKQALHEEISLMKEYPHAFIVKVIDDFLDNSGYQCMVLEIFIQGDFSKFLIERGDT